MTEPENLAHQPISPLPIQTSLDTVTKKSRPARLQVDPDSIPDDDKPPQTGNEFNIWYLRWSGGDSSSQNHISATHRCNIKLDAGYTRADKKTKHTEGGTTIPICLFFAKGCCYLGKKCPFFHRLPRAEDNYNPIQDCFGRDKSSLHQDNMNGVGTFNRENRTLYVGGIHVDEKIETKLYKNFEEWGKIERIRVLHSKNCAFVTYIDEVNSQFAKEAMNGQNLGGNEVLAVRWANEDPNPTAVRKEKRRLEEIAVQTIRNLLDSVDEQDNETKRPRIVVEQPESDEEVMQDKNGQKLLTENTDSPLTFNQSSLDVLRLIQTKKQEPVARETKSLGSMMSGYESSDDE